MNKQPSKESLKDKVKGIFGLGPQRPPSKQSDTKPSEFIITTDIIKVRKRDPASIRVSEHTNPFELFNITFCVFVYVFIQELHPDCGLGNRIRTMNQVCELAKTKKFEEVSLSL